MEMTVGRKGRVKSYSWRDLWRGSMACTLIGAACLEHLQIVPHEFYLIFILVCRPSRPTHEVQIVHYQYIPVLLHQI